MAIRSVSGGTGKVRHPGRIAGASSSGGGYSGPVPSTWNPSDKGTNMSLSGGNLIVTSSGAGTARGWRSRETGSFYFEVVIGSSGNITIGIAQSTSDLNTWAGNTPTSWSWFRSGLRYNNGAGNAYGGSGFTTGDVVGVLYNSGVLTFYKNGVSQGTAYSGLTGNMFPAFGATVTGQSGTLNTGQGAFTGGLPAGASAWD